MPNENDQNNGFTSRFYMSTPIEGEEPLVERYDIEALRLVDDESRRPVNIGDSTHPVYFLNGVPAQCSGGGGGEGGSDVAIYPKYKGGTLIANFSVDGQNGRIYSPTVAEVYKKATLWPPAGSTSIFSEVGDNNNSNPFKTMINNYEFLLIHYAPTNALSEERTMMLDAQALKDSLPDNAIFSCHYLSDVFIKCKFTSQDKFEVIESRGIPLDNEETPQMLKCAIKKIEGLQFGASGEDLDQGLTVKQVLWEGVATDVDESFRFRIGTVESFNYIYLHYYATNNRYEERILVLDQEAIINGLAQDPTAAYFTCDIADDLYIKGKFVSIDQFLITEVHSKTIDETVVKPVLSQIDGVCLGAVGGSGSGGASSLAELDDVLIDTPLEGQTLVFDYEGQKWINGGNYMIKGTDYVTAGHDDGFETSVRGSHATEEGYQTLAEGYYAHAEGYRTSAAVEASHAEGNHTKTVLNMISQNHELHEDFIIEGICAHAEGEGSVACGGGSHAEGGIGNGYRTWPYAGAGFHVAYWLDTYGPHDPEDPYDETAMYYPEGYATPHQLALGDGSHTEGHNTIAFGMCSHAQGIGTVAQNNGQTAIGINNIIDKENNYAFIIGNGTHNIHYIGSGGGTAEWIPENIFTVSWDGRVTCSSLSQTSSREVKENIKDMSQEEAEKLLNLRPVSFDYIEGEGDKDCYGLIAEEVQEAGIEYPVFNGTRRSSSEECLQLDYTKFVPYLIKMIQIQEERINNLEKELERKGVK